MKTVIVDSIKLDPAGRKKLEEIPDIQIYDDLPANAQIIIDRIKDAEIITANFIDITKEIIDQAPKLRYIISPAVGYDWIDATTAKEKNIRILNCPTFNTHAVAEHAIGLIFALKRNIVKANISILNGKFHARHFRGSEVHGKMLVTVGYGNIGKKVITLAQALGMKTTYIDSKATPEEFNEKIASADILVLCLPLTEKTKEIINTEVLSRMKKTAILINVARGLVVDQTALYDALSQGTIAGAGIDTFPDDQNLEDTPEYIMKFAQLPNVVATPHIGFNTDEAYARLGEELIVAIESCHNGAPVNVVV